MNYNAISHISKVYINAYENLNLYVSFAHECRVLVQHLKRKGWTFKLTVSSQPYEFMRSAWERRICYVYSGGTFSYQNPLRDLSGEYDFYGQPMINAHTARAIHDILGHYEIDSDFSFVGELLAHQVQSGYFSQTVQPVLYADNVGQLCYYYTRDTFVPLQRPLVMTPEPIGKLLRYPKVYARLAPQTQNAVLYKCGGKLEWESS